jgi:hypothetical protein
MLLSFKHIQDALQQNRCVLSRATLSVDDYVIGRTLAPSLYDSRLTVPDKALVRSVVQVLIAHSDETRSLLRSNPVISRQLQVFFGKCIAHTDSTDEAFLHAYIFLFWELVRSEVTLGRDLHLTPRWGSKEFGGVMSSPMSVDEKAMADQLVKAGVEIDLFSFDARTETLALIEVKRGESDDRAIGQLLRYYQAVWRLLPLSEFRRLNINYIWPILIVSKIKEEHVQALPIHFRGLLDVLHFASTGESAPSFSSFRRGAFTSRWM